MIEVYYPKMKDISCYLILAIGKLKVNVLNYEEFPTFHFLIFQDKESSDIYILFLELSLEFRFDKKLSFDNNIKEQCNKFFKYLSLLSDNNFSKFWDRMFAAANTHFLDSFWRVYRVNLFKNYQSKFIELELNLDKLKNINFLKLKYLEIINS